MKCLEEITLLAAQGASNMFKIVPDEEKLKAVMFHPQDFCNTIMKL